MSTSKNIDKICIAVTVLTLVITVLFMNGASLGIKPMNITENENALFSETDINGDFDEAAATIITLADGKSTVSGTGAYVNGDEISIVYAGDYILKGSLCDGAITVEADGDDTVRLLFDGVSINCTDSAALYVAQAKKCIITLADGTENSLSSGAEYSETAVANGIDGVLFSRDDLSFNGGGSLTLNGEYAHAVVCNDSLVIAGGNFDVCAAKDAFHAHDCINIKDADIGISAGDDALHAANDDETASFYMESGKITVKECYEGIEAVSVTIAGGEIDITSSDDGINANGSGKNSDIIINGGNIRLLNNTGSDSDGLDSNGSIHINGGNLFISLADTGNNSALDYGSENGGTCVVSGGTVIACGASGMAEGFSENSAQGFIMFNTQNAGQTDTQLSVDDESGNTLISAQVPYSFSNAVISTPEMKIGDKVTVNVNGNTEELTVDNSSTSFGGFGGAKGPKGGFAEGDFANGEAPQRPDGEMQSPPEMPGGEVPPMPDFANGEAPQRPDGEMQSPPEMPGGEMPSMPDFANGEAPQKPDGEAQIGETQTAPDIKKGDFQKSGRTDDSGKLPQNGENRFDKTALILTVVSFAVLAAGIFIAVIIKH